MFRGIETAATGMASIIDLNDIIANNLANINTPGFKQLIPAFKNIQDMPITQEAQNIGSLSLGSILETTKLDLRQGSIIKTDNRLDVAINGEGFFAVKTESGEECYTRNGSFSLNDKGELVTKAGDLVLDEGGGAINIDLTSNSTADIHITEDGRIMLKNDEIAKFKILNFPDKSALQAAGNTLLKNTDPKNTPEEQKTVRVTQGYLETSNANVVETMINSITGSRVYETLSKIVQSSDAAYKKLVSEVGRVQ